jgi:uncharacterized protein involved in exopolysaccharide biosynthesis
MKRLLKLLARLYPSTWHRRYGAEFETLLEDSTPRIRDLYDVFLGALKMQMTTWNFTRITLATCLTGALAAIAISFAIPSRYISRTLIIASPPVNAAATNDSGAGTKSDMRGYLINLEPDVLNRDSLSRIIERLNLYPRERANMPLDAVVTKMQSNIYVWPVKGTGLSAFFIQFDYPDPHVAQKVNGEVVSQLMSANLAYSASHPHLVFRVVDAPELPQKPAGPNRIEMGVIGLLIGLPAGLILALVIRLRHKPLTVSN